MSPLDGLLQAMEAQKRYGGASGRVGLEQQVAAQRIGRIEEGWKQNPGRRPGGSGSTGLASQDAQGWSEMLNEQVEHQNLQNTLDGKPLSVIQLQESVPKRQVPPPLSGASATTHNDFLKRYGR